MAVTDASDSVFFDAAARAEIARVRGSGVLGRSGRLLELFDFLVARSETGAPPKEVEIAVSVFGKSDAVDIRDDPIARVYVHRLRKRLDDFYASRSDPETPRLDLPRGEYRIVHARPETDAARAAAGPGAGPAPSLIAQAFARARAALERFPGRAAALAAAAVLAVNVGAWALIGPRGGELARVQAHPVWAPLVGDDRPLVIAVGDYYMFGDFTDGIFLERLIRDFSINSREELLEYQRFNPETYESYGDVNLRYLPTSSAQALAHVSPLAPESKPVRVVLASELTQAMIRDQDILYVGLFSGLGPLREAVFTASRFSFGDSYDELEDAQTGESYRSDAFVTSPYDAMYTDYALFSSLEGPTGNRIVALAGARDAGLAGLAEAVTERDSLEALRPHARRGGSFEALYRIHGRSQVSIESELQTASDVPASRIWMAENPRLAFPAE